MELLRYSIGQHQQVGVAEGLASWHGKRRKIGMAVRDVGKNVVKHRITPIRR